MKHSFKPARKLITATLLSVLIVLTSFSQAKQFSLLVNPLTSNFNYGNLNSGLQPYKKNLKGLQFGASCQSAISPTFSVVRELYFTMKGGILKENNPLTINKSTLRLYTIETPVLARLHVNHLYLNAGAYVAYTLGGSIKTEGSEAVPEQSIKVSFGSSSDAFKQWDFGAQAGAGYNFNMQKSTLTVDVRYAYGLVNISNIVARYNRALSISILVSKPPKKNKSAN